MSQRVSPHLILCHTPFDPFFSSPPALRGVALGEGLGSGVVFDANGDIVTNNHVVAGGGPYTVTAGAHSYAASLETLVARVLASR